MKILAVDYGSRRVGLALGDTETNLALPHGVLTGMSDNELVEQLKDIILEEEVKKTIVGEPTSLRGQVSEQTKICRQFAARLAGSLAIPVELFDERLTSRRSDAVTLGAAMPTRNRDELAAMFLLQDYLERQAFNEP